MPVWVEKTLEQDANPTLTEKSRSQSHGRIETCQCPADWDGPSSRVQADLHDIQSIERLNKEIKAPFRRDLHPPQWKATGGDNGLSLDWRKSAEPIGQNPIHTCKFCCPFSWIRFYSPVQILVCVQIKMSLTRSIVHSSRKFVKHKNFNRLSSHLYF